MKNTFRSLMAVLLALAMLLSFAACGNDAGEVIPEPEDGESQSEGEDAEEGESSESDAEEEGEVNRPSNAPDSFLDSIVDFHSRNNDTIGWLNVPGTDIDESVVQSSDNKYYLRRTNLKQPDRAGCYFADYECNFNDGHLPKNTIIYGHSMEMNDDPNGLRFSQLKRWLDKDFAEEHPYIYFSTPEKDYVYQIFSVMYTSTRFNYIDPEPSNTDFLNVINEARLASQYNYPVEVSATDSIITLSTCVYKFTGTYPNDYRYVIMGRLVKPGEETPDTVKIEVNPSPKAPRV